MLGEWWLISENVNAATKQDSHPQKNISVFGFCMWCLEWLVVLGIVLVQSPNNRRCEETTILGAADLPFVYAVNNSFIHACVTIVVFRTH